MAFDRRALLVVDVQNDFCEGGSLAVAGGTRVAAAITEYLREHGDRYAAVAATADWHVDPGAHFADEPDYVDSWPAHCRAGSPGAAFSPAVQEALASAGAVFRKGEHAAAYSGFEGYAREAGRFVGLADWLRERRVSAVDVAGLATDHCVQATALGALHAGFGTRVLLDLTAGVLPVTTAEAVRVLHDAGAELLGAPVHGG